MAGDILTHDSKNEWPLNLLVSFFQLGASDWCTHSNSIGVDQPVSYHTSVLVCSGVHSTIHCRDTCNGWQQRNNHTPGSQIAIFERKSSPNNHASSAHHT